MPLSTLRLIVWQPKNADGLSFLLPCLNYHTPYIAVVTYLLNLNQHEELSLLAPHWLPKLDACFEIDNWLAKNSIQNSSNETKDKNKLALIVANDPIQYSHSIEGMSYTIKKLKKYQTTPLVLMIGAGHGLTKPQRILFYQQIATCFNCLIHLGGLGDVDPVFYNESIRYAQYCSNLRDFYEIELVRYYYLHSTGFILGFCRGLQICNVAFNGSLYQDIKKTSPQASGFATYCTGYRNSAEYF